jgi:hypothetical protein
MTDTFDTFKANPSSVKPLTRAVCAAMPTTIYGDTVGPILSDAAIRKLLDALAALEP